MGSQFSNGDVVVRRRKIGERFNGYKFIKEF
jgi:hypothetical protein